jgi:murein DD-endopeptidase MepM/ murein hydrolase activator NlpD
MKNFVRDFKLFLIAWYKYLFLRGYRWFSHFETGKDLITKTLYRQRGRFARPFVHSAMGGIVAMAVTLAPVLASSFPGVDKTLLTDTAPVNQVFDVQVDETSTQVSDKVRDKVLEYVVQSGDTVSVIASKFGISSDTIRWENGLESVNDIKPGQSLKILPVTGVKHKVVRGETIYSIAKKYDSNPQAIVDFPFNTFADNEAFSLSVGQELIVPDGKKPNVIPWSPSLYVAQKTPDAGAVSAIGKFVWPMGGVITQRFSWYHRAIDIATAFGTPIVAADAGRVIVAGWPDNSGYGNRVEIDHGNGFITLYGHMSKIYVTAGQSVNRGDQIGLEGSTGRSTGPHLHFEIRKAGGGMIDPLTVLR